SHGPAGSSPNGVGPATGPVPGSPDGVEHTQLRGRPTSGGYLDPHYLSEPIPADTVVPVRSERDLADTAAVPGKSRVPAIAAAAGGLVVAGVLTAIVVTQGAGAPPVDTGGPTGSPTTAVAFDVLV